MLRRDLADIEAQARRIAAAIRAGVPGVEAAVVEGFSQMGSGSFPGQDLPTRLVAVQAGNPPEGEIARRLRRHDPPVFARVGQGRVLADPRTLLDGEEEIVVAAFCRVLGAANLPSPLGEGQGVRGSSTEQNGFLPSPPAPIALLTRPSPGERGGL